MRDIVIAKKNKYIHKGKIYDDISIKKIINKEVNLYIIEENLLIKSYDGIKSVKENVICDIINDEYGVNHNVLMHYEYDKKRKKLFLYSIGDVERIQFLCEGLSEVTILPIQFYIREITMKKIIISTIILSTCLGFVGCSNTVGLNNSYESSTTTSLNNSSENTNSNTINTNNIPYSTNQNLPTQNTISSDEAKQIALQHANLSDNQVTFIKVSQDYDDGINKYEIEFYYNNTEYDYEINAYSGEILKFDYDAEYYNPYNTISYSNSQSSSTQNLISSDEAKNIALQHANLTDNQVTFIKVSQDYDDGIHIYEVEFHYNNREYNYDINAINGTILSYEQD